MSITSTLKRRDFLRGSVLLSLVPLGLLQACKGQSVAACFDPEMLDIGEQHMRKTLAYVDISASEAESCNSCQFFHTGTDTEATCGECEILAGPVSSRAHCTSWAQKKDY